MTISRENDEYQDDSLPVRNSQKRKPCQLLEAGFEFVCDFGSNKVFRKHK